MQWRNESKPMEVGGAAITVPPFPEALPRPLQCTPQTKAQRSVPNQPTNADHPLPKLPPVLSKLLMPLIKGIVWP